MDVRDSTRLNLVELAAFSTNNGSRLNSLSAGDLPFVLSLLNSNIASEDPAGLLETTNFFNKPTPACSMQVFSQA